MSEKQLGKKTPAEKPISLATLKFEEAVSDLLKVKKIDEESKGKGDGKRI